MRHCDVDKLDALSRHVSILQSSYYHYIGQYLFDPRLDSKQAIAWLERAPFALVSHGIEHDPIFNYANQTALQLFGMTVDQFTCMPSRLSAEPMNREERALLLERVRDYGYIDDYTGIRIAANGQRFLIRNATVWNLLDEAGQFYGQAAMISEWELLQS